MGVARDPSVGLLLDRLLILEQPPRGGPASSGRVRLRHSRSCTLSFRVTYWVVLAMGLPTELPIRAVFKVSVSLHRLAKAPCRSTL